MAKKTSTDTWFTSRWNLWLPRRVQRLLKRITKEPVAEIERLVEKEAARCARKRQKESKRG